jgi:hypothetical protein
MQRCGTFAIPDGADGGSVTDMAVESGLSLRRVFAKVRKPAGGLNMFANIVDGTITSDGFDFNLSGAADNANYVLDYLMFITEL